MLKRTNLMDSFLLDFGPENSKTYCLLVPPPRRFDRPRMDRTRPRGHTATCNSQRLGAGSGSAHSRTRVMVTSVCGQNNHCLRCQLLIRACSCSCMNDTKFTRKLMEDKNKIACGSFALISIWCSESDFFQHGISGISVVSYTLQLVETC